jgi:hypothetical protein
LKPVPAAAKSKPAGKPEARPEVNHSAALKEPTGQNANKQPVKQEKSVQPSDKKVQPPAREKPTTNEQNGTNAPGKVH